MMRRAALVLLLALVACTHEPSDSTDKITVSPIKGYPPTPVLNALYLRSLDERLQLRHTPQGDELLFAAARATCGAWAAGLDFDRVVSTLPPWRGWHPWQEEWLVYSATITYCQQYVDRLPHE